MISYHQGKMARAGLGWTVQELAERASVAVNTVARFESGKPVNKSTLSLLKFAFEAAGVEFTNGDAPGVRLHKRGKE